MSVNNTAAVDRFRSAADVFHRRIAHWPISTWSRHAETVYALVQHLADLCAVAEAGTNPLVLRTVPRLHNNAALADQLAVMINDLLAANPETVLLHRAVDALAQANAQISGKV